jgi:signal transduction histidine kinase
LNWLNTALAAILVVALLLLYISLFPILHRVTRQLEARNRRLREHAAERDRLLEGERAARAEAETVQRLLARQNERLLELDELKDEFISLVSHELRTPLTSIRGYLELLLDDDLNAQQQSYLGIIDRNSNRLLGLVSDLLLLTQIEAGELAFEFGPVDLEEVVRECIESSAPAAEASDIQLATSTERVPVVRGHRVRLVQVVDNLISNALKFTPSGGRVDVRLTAVDGAAVIEDALFPNGPLLKRDATALEKLRQAINDKNFYWFNRYRGYGWMHRYGDRPTGDAFRGGGNGSRSRNEIAQRIRVITYNKE